MCVSWALTLFFSLSWRKLPWGSFLHGSTREALEQGPTHHIYCVCLSLSQLEASVTRSYSSIQADCSCLSPCVLYLYPCFDGIPTVNSCHLIQAADLKKKKQGQPQSTVANMCLYRIQQHTPSKQLSTTTDRSSAGDPSVSPLSPLSHIHLQSHLTQVVSLWQRERFCEKKRLSRIQPKTNTKYCMTSKGVCDSKCGMYQSKPLNMDHFEP